MKILIALSADWKGIYLIEKKMVLNFIRKNIIMFGIISNF